MDQVEELLTRGVADIYPNREELHKVLRSGKKLRVYQGFDPTGAQLHIGHAVALRKLRQFQDLGHEVIFLIGDFTALIGDPTGKLDARKMLTKEEVEQNAQHYKEQAARILRFDGDNAVQIKYNSEWLGKISALEFLQLAHHLTYQQVVERDMFQKRISQGQDVYMNEFLYPVMQAYDSVAMDVDLEIGGSDQMFNMLMGRKLMRNMKQKEKYVMTVPLLTDAQGVKIGKTEGNVIGLTDAPNDFYCKIMSLGDDAIIPCFTLLTDKSQDEIETLKQSMIKGENPMQSKKQLAYELTKQFNSEQMAADAQEEFEALHQKKVVIDFKGPELVLSNKDNNIKSFLKALVDKGYIESMSKARQLLECGAIKLQDLKTRQEKAIEGINEGDIIRVGSKLFVRIKLT